MKIKEVLNSRLTAVAAGATVLAVAVGGAGYAVGQIDSRDIKNNSVKSVDIKNNSVKSSDIKDRGVKFRDLSASAARRLKGQQGPAGPAGPASEIEVTGLSADGQGTAGRPFEATNPSVSLTPDGVEFGPYADGGSSGGSVCFIGLRDQPLSVVDNLVYFIRYTANGDTGGVGSPYLRIFTDDVADPAVQHSYIFTPNTQSPDPDIAEGPFHEYVATSGTFRRDDDPGNDPGAEAPFETFKTANGSEPINEICITTGGSNGADLSALLRTWQINGVTVSFEG